MSWVVLAGRSVLYAERDTREQAELVLEKQRDIVERFGPARILRRVVVLDEYRERGARRSRHGRRRQA